MERVALGSSGCRLRPGTNYSSDKLVAGPGSGQADQGLLRQLGPCMAASCLVQHTLSPPTCAVSLLLLPSEAERLPVGREQL